MHAQLSSEARSVNIGLSIHLVCHHLQCASSEGSDETAYLRSLARVFAARIRDKYQTSMRWLNDILRNVRMRLLNLLIIILKALKLRLTFNQEKRLVY